MITDSQHRNITSGVVRFDENMNVSESVKHLMFNLLQKDATKRLVILFSISFLFPTIILTILIALTHQPASL